MNQLQTIIVDDEPLALSLMKSKLKRYDSINIIAECKNGRDAIAAILEHEPDLVFLDIEMPKINGFDVIHKTQPSSRLWWFSQPHTNNMPLMRLK